MAGHFGGAPFDRRKNEKAALFLSFFFLLLFGALSYRLLISESAKPTRQVAAVVNREEPNEISMKEVLVPLRRIEKGQKLHSAMFKVDKRPTIGVSYGAVSNFDDINGKYSNSLLLPGQEILKEALLDKEPTSPIGMKIPAGFRAVTIRVDTTSSVAGWARPTSRVDVNLITKVNNEPTIVTIVNNAEVLSANRQSQVNDNNNVNNDTAAPTTVTLLMKASDSQKIHLAESIGQLDLTLRGDNDSKVEGDGSITTSELVVDSRIRNVQRKTSGGTISIGGKKFLVDEYGSLIDFSK